MEEEHQVLLEGRDGPLRDKGKVVMQATHDEFSQTVNDLVDYCLLDLASKSNRMSSTSWRLCIGAPAQEMVYPVLAVEAFNWIGFYGIHASRTLWKVI